MPPGGAGHSTDGAAAGRAAITDEYVGGTRRPGREWSLGRRLSGGRVFRFLAAGLCGSSLLVGCGSPADETDARVQPQFAGGAVCADCHRAEFDRWQDSHHDLAMQPATPETVLGDFDRATFEYFGTISTFFRRGDRFYVRTDGPDGKLTDFAVSYTFGVTPLQQYLIEFPDGRLQALGIAWDSRPADQGGQRWFHLYPTERIPHDDPLHWTRSYQNWNHMCAECHSTNLRKNYREEVDRFETSWTDIDVSCEACHGPGSEHVRLANALQEGEDFPDGSRAGLTVTLRASDLGVWTIDPETGTARRGGSPGMPLIDVCAPCHSRRTSLSQDVVAGRPFLDTHRPALLEEGLYHPDGQILDEVYVYGSFIQSKMHAAGVTCANCHDSHGLRLVAEGNALCAQCHLASKFDSPQHHFHKAEGEGGLCVGCHMPTRTYMGVDVRRDHSMQIPRPDLTVAIGTPNACNACHADRSPEWAAAYAQQWYGAPGQDRFAGTIAAARRQDPGGVESLVTVAADSTLPPIVRATAVALMAEFPWRDASPALERATADGNPLLRLAAARTASSRGSAERTSVAMRLLYDSIRVVRSEAALALANGNQGEVPPEHMAAYERALGEARASLQLHGDRPESHVGLALIDAAAGRLADAETELRTAILRDSLFDVAYANLADLFRSRGRDQEGEAVLRRGLRSLPESAALRHALGLALVRMGRRDEAMQELRSAAALAPDSPRFVYTFAIALHSAGKTSDAVEVLDRAVATHPYDTDILAALVTLHLEIGKRDRALHFARRLADVTPHNMEVQDLIQSLGGEG